MHLEHRCIMYAAFFGAFIYVNERKLEYSSCVCLYIYIERERERESNCIVRHRPHINPNCIVPYPYWKRKFIGTKFHPGGRLLVLNSNKN